MSQLATKIDDAINEAVKEVCRQRGLKISKFVEEALLDKLEELEDIEDLKSLRREPTRPLKEVLKELKADGKL